MNIMILTDWDSKASRAYNRLVGSLSAEDEAPPKKLAWLGEKREFIAEIIDDSSRSQPHHENTEA